LALIAPPRPILSILSHLITPHTRSRTIQPVSSPGHIPRKSRFSAHALPPFLAPFSVTLKPTRRDFPPFALNFLTSYLFLALPDLLVRHSVKYLAIHTLCFISLLYLPPLESLVQIAQEQISVIFFLHSPIFVNRQIFSKSRLLFRYPK